MKVSGISPIIAVIMAGSAASCGGGRDNSDSEGPGYFSSTPSCVTTVYGTHCNRAAQENQQRLAGAATAGNGGGVLPDDPQYDASIPRCAVDETGMRCNAAGWEVNRRSKVPSVASDEAPKVGMPADDPIPAQPASGENIVGTDGSTTHGGFGVRLVRVGGTWSVPALINHAISLDFIVDSGAADVSLPADVILTLMRTGTIDRSDFVGSQTYVLADGSRVPSPTIRLRSLTVGGHEVRNVIASVERVEGSLLLGESFLSRFSGWAIDNRKHVLRLQ